MLYIILIIIAVLVYLIYKGQKSKVEPKVDYMELIPHMEKCVLEKIEKNTGTEEDRIIFDCGKKNFIRLDERFKHDKLKLLEIYKDRYDYLNATGVIVYNNNSPLLVYGTENDVKRLNNEVDEFFIKFQEINKRFKDLLGDDYVDYKEFLKPILE